jgi:ribosomal protein S12 methylthiotransferase accessory factor
VSCAAPAPGASSAGADAFLEVAAAAARRCGVTRLADITGLDRIGLPVWQAVRPLGRALSVHQGKGASDNLARIGALCEAIESHCAELAPADGPLCRFAELPEEERAPDLSDYLRRREAPAADEPLRWCRAETIRGEQFWLPHDLVSLDFTEDRKSAFDRSSAGLGLGPDKASAIAVALREQVERDAVGEWQRRPLAERMPESVELDTIPFAWFGAWREKLASLGIDLAVFAVASVAGLPVVICWMGGAEAFGPGYRSFSGSACHDDPGQALFKALAEAAQSRLTFIAGVRDDILPVHYKSGGAPFAVPVPGRPWPYPEGLSPPRETIAARLSRAGYSSVAVKQLGLDLEGLAVVKAFVPGLGSLKRTRREAKR